MEFLSHPGERRAQIVGVLQLEVPAAGLLRERPQTAVGPAAHPAHAVEVVALEPDGVDHHLFELGHLQHFAPADLALRVLAVGEHQHHLAAVEARERLDARRDGVVQPGRVAELQAVELADQGVAVAGEVPPPAGSGSCR